MKRPASSNRKSETDLKLVPRSDSQKLLREDSEKDLTGAPASSSAGDDGGDDSSDDCQIVAASFGLQTRPSKATAGVLKRLRSTSALGSSSKDRIRLPCAIDLELHLDACCAPALLPQACEVRAAWPLRVLVCGQSCQTSCLLLLMMWIWSIRPAQIIPGWLMRPSRQHLSSLRSRSHLRRRQPALVCLMLQGPHHPRQIQGHWLQGRALLPRGSLTTMCHRCRPPW